MNTDGLLLIDKPSGWTSHDVVAKVRGILKREAGHKVKVGHTGTLDPLATGLMIVVTGRCCKRAAEFSKLDKTYEVTMKLGITSTTGDEEGTMTTVSDKIPNEKSIKNAIAYFMGTYEQMPPAFSAIKVDGQRAYKLAREGKEVKLEPRKVTILSINLENYAYPEVKFIAHVSSGTYIRSLVEDIGSKLGTGAYMNALRRTEIGKFKLNEAVDVIDVGIDKIANTC